MIRLTPARSQPSLADLATASPLRDWRHRGLSPSTGWVMQAARR